MDNFPKTVNLYAVLSPEGHLVSNYCETREQSWEDTVSRELGVDIEARADRLPDLEDIMIRAGYKEVKYVVFIQESDEQ